jgi:hypothetical protein
MMIFILPAFVSFFAVTPAEAPAVSNPAFCVVPPPAVSAKEAVRTADAIVRAVPVRQRTGAAADSVGLAGDHFIGWLDFKVVEVLKGRDVPAVLYIRGFLTESDDFNSGPVPYRFMRSGAYSGACHAYGHRRRGEFLLLLRKERGRLTPYYASAPTNEQVRGADDPWVAWVRARLATAF